MAYSRISDFYEPITISEVMKERQLERNAFLKSGAAVTDEQISNFLVGDTGRKLDKRFIAPLTITEPNEGGDDAAVTSTPQKRTGSSYQVVKHIKNESWSAMNILPAVDGVNPIELTGQLLGDYWNAVTNVSTIKSLQGILADNIASDSSDMLNDIWLGSGTLTDANYISASALIDTAGTMGDFMQDLKIIIVHSQVYIRMQKLELIDTIPDSEQNIFFNTYQGKIVLVDDNMPVDTTVPGYYKYTTALLGAGAIAYGIADAPIKPLDLEDSPSAGNGAGQETLYSRQNLVIAPQGFDYSNTTSTIYSALVSAANWDRKFQRKNCKIAFLTSNG